MATVTSRMNELPISKGWHMQFSKPSQEGVVVGIAAFLFVAFSVALPGFLSPDNLLTLVKNVSLLGSLALGMSIVVLGRGIDLAQIATMVVGVAVALGGVKSGMGAPAAVAIGAAFVACVGVVSGVLIAYADIPAIFATLAMGSVVYGGGRYFYPSDVIYAPGGIGLFDVLGKNGPGGIPVPVLVFAALSALAGFLLRRTRLGRFIYATGDNPYAARTIGLPVRPVIVVQYVLSALVAYCAGLLLVGLTSGINTRLYNSTLLYDVLLVVVLGGIGLAGGRGGVRNVMIGTAFVGILLNGMTILNLGFTTQNLCKSVVLLAALVADSLLNPREEQTAQQGDI